MAVYKITVYANSGTGGTSAFYFDSVSQKFYSSTGLTEEITSIVPHTRESFRFAGCYSTNATTGVLRVSADGTIVKDGWTPTGAATIYAQWERVSWKITVNRNGGTGGTASFYFKISTESEEHRFFSDDQCEYAISSIELPTRSGYSCNGCYSASSGGVQYVSADGIFTDAFEQLSVTAEKTIYAQWSGNQYTLEFDYVDGHGDTVSKSVTFGSAIGTLPTPTTDKGTFAGWYLNGIRIYSSTVWNTPGNGRAVANYNYYFARLTDWFGLETANGPLMLVASTDGSARSVVETSHSGSLAIQAADSSVGAFERGGILLKPSCTYRIRKSGTVQLQLGKAYGSATITGTGTTANPYRVTKSGFILVQAEYRTAADGEPILVVRGAANEGYVWNNGRMVSQLTDAINQWSVNLDVNPDHIAQDPMIAVNGGGELTECKTLITCDPVVPIEGGMPCASDVVHGKIAVTATTNAYLGESAPTAAGSFVETNGDPNSETDVDFTSYAFQAERSL